MSLSTGCVLDVDASAIESGISRDRNHHTLTPTDCTTVRGKAGKGTLFNGTTSFVDCGNDASLNITDVISIEGRTSDSINGAYFGYILSKTSVYSLYKNNDDTVKVLLHTTDGYIYKLSSQTIDWAQQYYLSFSYDGSGNIKIFINGLDKTGSGGRSGISNVLDTNSNHIYVGSNSAFVGYFNGTISSVKIYNYALSPTEIKRHYLEKAYLHVPHPVRIP